MSDDIYVPLEKVRATFGYEEELEIKVTPAGITTVENADTPSD
jgi:hypothetical protein